MPSQIDQFNNCTEVTPACPIEGTLYGYYPNVPANGAYAFIFAMCFVAQLFFGIRYKTKSYAIAVCLGCFMECVGYVSRIFMHSNPWKKGALATQLINLIIGPAFLAAGIYLILKHVVLAVEPRLSLIPARLYTWIFISCDIVSILIQGVGGAVASKAVTGDTSVLGPANDILMTGITVQVVTLVIFGGLAGLYARNVYQHGTSLHAQAAEQIRSRRFHVFVFAMVVAYTAILVRCIYRIAEMAGGWKNPVSRNQTEFMLLDGFMCIIASLSMTIFHPGIWFPQMQQEDFEPIGTGTSDAMKNSRVRLGVNEHSHQVPLT